MGDSYSFIKISIAIEKKLSWKKKVLTYLSHHIKDSFKILSLGVNKTCINFIIFILIFVENCLLYEAMNDFSVWVRTG